MSGEGEGTGEGEGKGPGNLGDALPGGQGDGNGVQAPTFADNWHEGIADSELRSTIEHKGWNHAEGPAAMVKSYRELETLMRGKMDGYTKIPGEDADDDARNAFYSAVGRPENADGYQPPEFSNLAEGDAVPDWFRSVAHETGLSQDQYSKVMASYDGYMAEVEDQQISQLQEEAKTGNQELQREWGDKYAENVAIGNRAVKALDLSQDEILDLQSALGTARATKILFGVGQNIGEDSAVFEGGDGSGSPFAGDLAWAMGEKNKLMANDKFQGALGNAAAMQDPSIRPMVEKWDRVNQIIASAKAA